MPSPTRTRGDRAEHAALVYLKRHGWSILDTNVLYRVGELDIVAADPDTGHLVFVEVRSGRPNAARPEDTVTRPKQRRLTKAAQLYLAGQTSERRAARFDVISVCSASPPSAHYRGAFEACVA